MKATGKEGKNVLSGGIILITLRIKKIHTALHPLCKQVYEAELQNFSELHAPSPLKSAHHLLKCVCVWSSTGRPVITATSEGAIYFS